MSAIRATAPFAIATALVAATAAGGGAQTGSVTGTVYDSIQHAPLSDAAVFLWDTPHQAVSDAEGRFVIDGVPPGEYSVLFFHTRLGEMGASAGPRTVTVDDGEQVVVELATPSMFTLVSSQCLLESHAEGTGVVAGWVGDGASGMGLPGASVTLSWNVADSPSPERLNLTTAANGWYRTCSAPVGVPLSASSRFLDRQSLQRELTVSEDGLVEAGFLLYELSAANVVGHLLDAGSGAPVPEAVVWLRGTSIRGLSDSGGGFEFEGVPPGRYMMMTDHIAYGTKMDTLEIPAGKDISVEMRLDTRPIEIAPLTVTVEATPVPERARGGIRIGKADVERVRLRSRNAVDILRAQNIPGVIIRERSDGSLCVGYAPGQVRMMFNTGCVPMMIFVNDARASNHDLVLQLPPDAVDRMVIYKPVEAGNGVLVIYTRGN